MEKYTKRVSAYMEGFLEKEGYRLLKTEFVEEEHSWYLRVYIDLSEEERKKRAEKAEAAAEKEAEKASQEEAEAEADEDNAAECGEDMQQLPGIGIDDCVKVSRRLSKWLDQEDFIREAYTLEVCSGGFLKTDEKTGEE